jgi:hypothetical protein
MVCRYIDCQSQGLALCSQSGVLSLPVVKLYFGGQLSAEFVRTFAMSQVKEAIMRPYTMLFD